MGEAVRSDPDHSPAGTRVPTRGRADHRRVRTRGTGSGISGHSDARAYARPLRAALSRRVPVHRRSPLLESRGESATCLPRCLLALVAATDGVARETGVLLVRMGAAGARAANPASARRDAAPVEMAGAI